MTSMSVAFPSEPDLTVRQAAALAGLSYWTVLKEIERGRLRAYRRPGNRLAIRRDDFCAWAYAEPVTPKPAVASDVDGDWRRHRERPPERGSLAALRAIEEARNDRAAVARGPAGVGGQVARARRPAP